jgi:acyl-coenzyme A thioesterase PaaI-like protein
MLQNKGLRVEKLEKDCTRLSIAPSAGQPKGPWQGGMLAALVDVAAGQALRTTLRSDYHAVTVHLDAKYFLPIATGRAFAEGPVVRKCCVGQKRRYRRIVFPRPQCRSRRRFAVKVTKATWAFEAQPYPPVRRNTDRRST